MHGTTIVHCVHPCTRSYTNRIPTLKFKSHRQQYIVPLVFNLHNGTVLACCVVQQIRNHIIVPLKVLVSQIYIKIVNSVSQSSGDGLSAIIDALIFVGASGIALSRSHHKLWGNHIFTTDTEVNRACVGVGNSIVKILVVLGIR